MRSFMQPTRWRCCRSAAASSGRVGALVFTDILVSRETPDEDRARIYDRVKSPDMWDLGDYRRAFSSLKFPITREEDWSSNVAPSYAWVRDGLEGKREALLPRVGAETIDNTVASLTFWVESAESGKIGWALIVAKKPE